jgi:hypothetical protein
LLHCLAMNLWRPETMSVIAAVPENSRGMCIPSMRFCMKVIAARPGRYRRCQWRSGSRPCCTACHAAERRGSIDREFGGAEWPLQPELGRFHVAVEEPAVFTFGVNQNLGGTTQAPALPLPMWSACRGSCRRAVYKYGDNESGAAGERDNKYPC